MSKDHNRLISQQGVAYIEFLAAQYRCLFRRILEHDKGVDAEIEITQSIGVISPILAIQVKSRTEFTPLKSNQISITVTQQNLDYWKSYGRPVLLVVYSEENKSVCWSRVDTITTRTIRVNIEQEFDENSIEDFKKIISEYYTGIAKRLPIQNISDVLNQIGITVDEVLLPLKVKVETAQRSLVRRDFSGAITIYDALAKIYDSFPIKYNYAVCLFETNQIKKAMMATAIPTK